MSLFAKNENMVPVTFQARLACLIQGGHDVYFNTEFGGLWCYKCGAAWECDPPVDNR